MNQELTVSGPPSTGYLTVEWGKAGYVSSADLPESADQIFRDAAWGGMRLIFRVDHKVSENGTYDYPHRHWLRRMGMAWPGLSWDFGGKACRRGCREMVKPARAAVQAEIRRNKHVRPESGLKEPPGRVGALDCDYSSGNIIGR